MDGLTMIFMVKRMIFMVTSIIEASIAIWINTRPGKKWLKSL